MSQNDEAVATVGGGYVESDEFTPNPMDLHGTFNTSGVGAHHDPSTVSPMFEVDRKATAAQIVAALDPEDTSVSADTVLLPEGDKDPEAAKEAIKAQAQALLDEGPVVIGGPTPAEAEAAKEGDEGAAAAAKQEAKASSETSATTGQHGSADADGGNAQGADDEPKGKALDEALEKAGLSKDGTADEKRARLREHQAK